MILYIIAIIAMVIFMSLFMMMPKLRKKNEMNPNPRYFAHRGLFDNKAVPENTCTAFERAVLSGFGIELDVQLSKDGVPVVFHDWNVKRMTGVDRVLTDMNLEEIKAMHLLDTNERIPTFAEALTAVGGKTSVIVEIKNKNKSYRLCVETQKLLDEYDGTYCIESFNPIVLRWYKKNRPNVMRGQLSTDYRKDEPTGFYVLDVMLSNMMFNFLTKPDFVAYNTKYKNVFGFRLCKAMGAYTYAWTVKNGNDLRENREFSHIIFDSFMPHII